MHVGLNEKHAPYLEVCLQWNTRIYAGMLERGKGVSKEYGSEYYAVR